MIKQKSSFKNTFKSVAAAFFGVQSNENRVKDFNEGKLSHFIFVGVICVIGFVAGLITLVYFVMP